MSPEALRPEVEVEGNESQLLQQHASSTEDVLAAAMNELGDRGITNPEQFAALGADAIVGTVRWFDAQNGRVGTGVLVAELRAGGKPGWQPRRNRNSGQQSWTRLDEWTAWLAEHMPDLQPDQSTNLGAFQALWRLNLPAERLSVAEHGELIRGAVRAWRERWEAPESNNTTEES